MTEGTITYDQEKVIFYDQMTKTASQLKSQGKYVTANIHLPASWVGKKVLCLLLEEPDNTE